MQWRGERGEEDSTQPRPLHAHSTLHHHRCHRYQYHHQHYHHYHHLPLHSIHIAPLAPTHYRHPTLHPRPSSLGLSLSPSL